MSNFLPLFDIIENKIKLIHLKNINKYVEKNHYRIPYPHLITKNTKGISMLKKCKIEEIYKLFFYNLSSTLKNITHCPKPNFIYIKKGFHKPMNPYYTKTELISLALYAKIVNWNNKTKELLKDTHLIKLCNKINKIELDRNQIYKHGEYIRKNKGTYIIRYYSFIGDYFINNYLRNLQNDQIKNKLIERNTKILYNLIDKAPAFNKEFYIYRRIGTDSHLSHLKNGDIYLLNSFMSTTRDPFFIPDGYTFGNIAMRIRVPPNMAGIGLSIEMYSYFPEELEILIPPSVQLKLLNIHSTFYHSIKKERKNVIKIYEFEIIGKEKFIFSDKINKMEKPIPIINFFSLQLKGNNHKLRLNEFENKIINHPHNQFISEIFDNINNKPIKYLFSIYNYDSTEMYREFFYYKKKNGFSFIVQNPINGQICLLIEIDKEMVVNYHSKFFDTDDCPKFIELDNDDIQPNREMLFIRFLVSIAYAFRIQKIILYPNMMVCSDFIKKAKTNDLWTQYKYRNSTYQKDLYDYLRYDKLRFR
jgi:hypothetical protein